MFQREQMHDAAQCGDLVRVRELLNHGYPVNRFDSLGRTPLHYAAAGEHFDVVLLLLSSGADVNARDEQVIGNTPLADIVDHCSVAMARQLIEAGADPSIPGWMKLTALDRAEMRKR